MLAVVALVVVAVPSLSAALQLQAVATQHQAVAWPLQAAVTQLLAATPTLLQFLHVAVVLQHQLTLQHLAATHVLLQHHLATLVLLQHHLATLVLPQPQLVAVVLQLSIVAADASQPVVAVVVSAFSESDVLVVSAVHVAVAAVAARNYRRVGYRSIEVRRTRTLGITSERPFLLRFGV